MPNYQKTKRACYMGFITQAIAANFAPLLFLKFHTDYHISLGNIAFALDAVIVILGTVIVSRDVDSLIYGLIVSYLLSLVMDKVMYGIDEGKLALIVTDPEHSTEICFKIDEVLGRGSTILNGMGSYSKDDKHIIMCACNNKQMYGIRKLIKTIDPKSFLVIMESNDVVGEGFKDE